MPMRGVLDFPGLAPILDRLKRADTIAFDARSRPEFGAVPRLLAERGPFAVEIGNRHGGRGWPHRDRPAFGADGNVVLSEVNFRRIVKNGCRRGDLVAIRLRPGSDIAATQARLRALLPPTWW
jgi:putative ABC transport system permease protein